MSDSGFRAFVEQHYGAWENYDSEPSSVCVAVRAAYEAGVATDDDVSLMTILNAERYEMLCEFFGEDQLAVILGTIQRRRLAS